MVIRPYQFQLFFRSAWRKTNLRPDWGWAIGLVMDCGDFDNILTETWDYVPPLKIKLRHAGENKIVRATESYPGN